MLVLIRSHARRALRTRFPRPSTLPFPTGLFSSPYSTLCVESTRLWYAYGFEISLTLTSHRHRQSPSSVHLRLPPVIQGRLASTFPRCRTTMTISTDAAHNDIEGHSPSSTPAGLGSTTPPSDFNPEGCFPSPFAAPTPVRAGNPSALVELKSDKIPAVVAVRELEMPRTPSPTPSEAQVLAEKPRMCGNWRRFVDMQRYKNNPRAICTCIIIFHVMLF